MVFSSISGIFKSFLTFTSKASIELLSLDFSGGQEKSVDEIAARQTPLKERLPSSSNNQTDRFKFTSSPVDTVDDGQESERQQKEKDRLHQKFVKKLGGVDCIIGIGRSAVMDDDDAAAGPDDNADGDENEEPTPPPTTKGKGRAVAKKSPPKLTPMEKQVIDIKSKHMDTLLIVEVGYKFRFFGEDARIAAKELGIVCIPGKMRFDERTSILPLFSEHIWLIRA
jgi:DNA mismatch repair protein MSH3